MALRDGPNNTLDRSPDESACFPSSVVRRRLNEIAPPSQLRLMPLSLNHSDTMIKALLGAVVLGLSLAAMASAPNRRWRSFENRKVLTFDFNCARTDSFPKTSLSKVVQRAIKSEDRGGLGTYGDRAFAIILQNQSGPIYFVPTVCGATGNCTWRLYTIRPLKYLGEINGQYIYTYQSADVLPTIITYGHISASEGGLSTYVANRGMYRRLGGEYWIDAQRLNGHPMPKFLQTAKPQCKDYGG